jgi:hypothetical protein
MKNVDSARPCHSGQTLRLIEQQELQIVSNSQPKGELALADLIRDLAYAEEARKKLYAAIVRLVQRREADGPAKDMMAQIRRDEKLCKLLVDYEEKSEIIGMMQFVRDLKMKPPRRTSHRTEAHDNVQ